MAHAVGVRATSLGAAVLMLGAGLFAALNMTYAIVDWGPPDNGPTIEMTDPPIPIPPDDPPEINSPPEVLQPVEQLQSFVLPYETFTDTSAMQTPTSFVPSGSGPIEITRPDWISRPRELDAYYPRRALARGVEGVVQLDCRVSVMGDLACAVRSETPQNMGFGAAALQIAADHRMHPATRDGVPVEGRYSMRVPFALH